MDPADNSSLWQRIKPFLIASFCFALGIGFFSVDVPEEEKMKSLGFAATGLVCFVIGFAFIISPLIRLVSAGFESLFWPSDSYIPPPNFKLAEWYQKEGRYGESIAEYEKMLKHHSHNSDVYLGLIRVQLLSMGDSNSALKTYNTALKKIKDPQALEQFQRDYEALSGA